LSTYPPDLPPLKWDFNKIDREEMMARYRRYLDEMEDYAYRRMSGLRGPRIDDRKQSKQRIMNTKSAATKRGGGDG